MGKLACEFYVRDKETGSIHKVGTDTHDAIWVDAAGELHYRNLQNGDGCSGKSHLDNRCGYEFVQSDCGDLVWTDEGGNIVALDTRKYTKSSKV